MGVQGKNNKKGGGGKNIYYLYLIPKLPVIPSSFTTPLKQAIYLANPF